MAEGCGSVVHNMNTILHNVYYIITSCIEKLINCIVHQNLMEQYNGLLNHV